MNFKVHASLIRKLGDELIGNDITAIIEMIKNSYDADSSYCKVSIDTEYSLDDHIGKIEILDDGCGMDLDDIKNGWLVISDSKKKDFKKNKRRTKKGRWVIGEKGIGRLASQKLGKVLRISTKKSGTNIELQMIIDWTKFDNDSTIDEIKIEFKEDIVVADGSYTKLEIIGLNTIDSWEKTKGVDDLQQAMSQILSPFTENEFYLTFLLNNKLIKINTYEDISESSEANHRITINNGEIIIENNLKENFFFDPKNNNMLLKKDELNDFFKFLNKKKPNVFSLSVDNDSIYNKTILTFDKCIIGQGLLKEEIDIGEIFCSIDTYTESPYKYVNREKFANKARYIKNNYGVKIIRNDFLVYPYGFGSEGDWLGLSKSSEKSGSFYSIANVRSIGYVKLDEEKTISLKETTNREGFIKDDMFNYLLKSLQFAISDINTKRNTVKRALNEYLNGINEKKFEKTNKKVMTKQKALNELVNKLDKQVNENNNDIETSFTDNNSTSNTVTNDVNIIKFNSIKNGVAEYTEVTTELINEMTENFENKIKYIEQSNEQLLELASLGMTCEIFTHEILVQLTRLDDSIKTCIGLLENSASEFTVLSRYLRLSLTVIEGLKNQIKIMLPGVQSNKNKLEVITLEEIIKSAIKRNESYLRRNNIEENIIIEKSYSVNIVIGKFMQCLDSIIDNSIHWLGKTFESDKIKEKKLSFYVDENELIIHDNGIGINKDDAKMIFDPFFTRKIIDGDPGRGLGLYICNELLKSMKSSIRVVMEENEFGNLYKFAIDLTNLLEG